MDYHNYSQNAYSITCNRNSPILVVTAHFIKVWICLDFIISITHVVAKGGVYAYMQEADGEAIFLHFLSADIRCPWIYTEF